MANVLDVVYGPLKRSRRFWTRKRSTAAVSVATQLLALAATRRPNLGPVQAVFSTLFSGNDKEVEETEINEGAKAEADKATAAAIQLMRQKIKVLREQLKAAEEADRPPLQARVDTLVAAATELCLDC